MSFAKSIVMTPTPELSPTPTIVSKPTNVPPTPTLTASLSGFCQKVPVLLYHHIEPLAQAKTEGHAALTVDSGWFDKQMAYLSQKGYTTINADQLAQSLRNHQGLPAKSILVTLDDGYIDVYQYAYPIAQKYHIVLNLMIPTGLMGAPDYFSWGQLKQMVDSGQVFAYDHTWSHAALANVSADKLKFEVMTAKSQLEQYLGKSVDIFTYPYGSQNNKVVNFLTANGFIAAFSEIPGFMQCDSFIMSLHRNHVGNAPLSSYGL